MDEDLTRTEVIRLIVQHQRVNPSKIKDNSRLESDLGITGDDAGELMDAFFEQFKVDASAFRFEEFFSPEACWPWEIFKRPPGKPVTVSDLVMVAKRGTWK